MSVKNYTTAKTVSKTALQKPKKISSILILTALICSSLILACVIWKPLVSMVSHPQQLQSWAQSPFGPLILIGIRTVQTILTVLPAEAVEIGAGYAFGPLWGLVWCIIGSAAGSVIIYYFTRLFGIRLVSRLIPINKLAALPIFINTRRRNLLVFLIFLIPGTPKDTLTYLIGLTPIRLPAFLILSSIARLPSIITSTISGAALGNQNYISAGIILGITAILGLTGIFFYRHILKKGKSKGMKINKPVKDKSEVIKMAKNYPDLYTLMEEDAQAQQYFSTLPDYVQEQISTRAGHVNSIESLKDYAENLLRGDD